MKSFGFVPVKGAAVLYEKQSAVIIRVKGHQSLIELISSEVRSWVDNDRLSLHFETEAVKETHITISWGAAKDEYKEKARDRLEIINEVLKIPARERTRASVNEIAEKHQFNVNTVYRWLKVFDGSLDSLLPRRSFDESNFPIPESRLDKGTNSVIYEIIQEAIEGKTLESRRFPQWQRLTVQSLYKNILEACSKAGYPTPCQRTVKRRLDQTLSRSALAKLTKGGAEAWTYVSTPGTFTEGSYPYALLQIDHTLLNIVILDEKGNPIGQPWITVAIDIFSRCVVAFQVSLDPPSAGVVGLVISRAILPKKDWLEALDPKLLEYELPFYGIPAVIHSDNAKDMVAEGIMETLDRLNIESNRRPTRKPNYGGHIEAYVGGLTKLIYALPGAKPERKSVPRDYDPDKYATHTIDSLNKWLAHSIFGEYNYTEHDGIDDIPVKCFIRGLLEKTGAPEIISGKKARDLRISLLPSFEATIQRHGITQYFIEWFHPICRAVVDHYGTGRGKSFKTRFYYDPAGMKRIYFINPLDPQKGYVEATWRDSRPDFAEWEVTSAVQARRLDKKRRANHADITDVIFKSMEARRKIDEEQVSQKRKAARRTARRVEDKKKRGKSTIAQPAVPVPERQAVPSNETSTDVITAKGTARWKA